MFNKIFFSSQNNNIVNETPHLCTPDFLKNEIDERLYSCKQEIIKGNYPAVPQSYNNMIATLENSGLDLVCKIPTFNSVKSSLYRFRNVQAGVQCLQPQLVRNVEVPNQFTNFLLADYADGDSRILIFCTEKAKLSICKATDFYSDGTFKSCPKPFSQLYVIHADMGSTSNSTNLMPIVYALMSERNVKSYFILFSMIKAQIPGWNPVKYKTDFEKAAMTAIKNLFPQVNTKGCYYHYNKAVWEKARKLQITKSKDVKKIREVALSAVLPLLPAHEISNGWKYITRYSTQEEDLKKFRKYFEEQWLKEEFIPIWCAYGEQHRTTNFLEAWNHKLNQEIGKKNPNIIHLLNVLVKDSAYFSVCDNINKTKMTPFKKRKKNNVLTDQFILEIQLELLHGNISVGHFLETVRH